MCMAECGVLYRALWIFQECRKALYKNLYIYRYTIPRVTSSWDRNMCSEIFKALKICLLFSKFSPYLSINKSKFELCPPNSPFLIVSGVRGVQSFTTQCLAKVTVLHLYSFALLHKLCNCSGKTICFTERSHYPAPAVHWFVCTPILNMEGIKTNSLIRPLGNKIFTFYFLVWKMHK